MKKKELSLLSLVFFICAGACAVPLSVSPAPQTEPASTSSISLSLTPAESASVSRSVDGRIAFVTNKTGNNDIYIMNPDGAEMLPLTSHPADENEPAWSPDGSRITFTSDRDGDLNIYIINSDGSDEMQLTESPNFDHSPHWSPDGRQIVFVTEVPAPSNDFPDFTSDIIVIDADGGGWTQLTESFPIKNSYPIWSPDGSRIAFVSTMQQYCCEVFTIKPDGTDLVQLTHFKMSLWSPAWSPDGKKIAFGGDNTYLPLGGAIYVMDAEGRELLALTNSPARADWGPAWSPDGTKIAFDATLEGELNSAIYVMNADGTDVTRLGENVSGAAPAWSP